jgi:hypothetical protein
MGRNGGGQQGAGGEERFEVRLSGEDLIQARRSMAATGLRKKSDFVRMMLTRTDLRDRDGIGGLCLQVNELILRLQEHGVDAGTAPAIEDIRRQLRLLLLADAGLRPGRRG